MSISSYVPATVLVASSLFLLPGRAEAAAPSLALAGTIVGTGARSAAVIVDAPSRQQYLLYEGDTMGDAVIEKVESRRIVLAVGGKKVVLMLNGGIGTASVAQNEMPPVTLPPDLMPPPPPPAPAPMLP